MWTVFGVYEKVKIENGDLRKMTTSSNYDLDLVGRTSREISSYIPTSLDAVLNQNRGAKDYNDFLSNLDLCLKSAEKLVSNFTVPNNRLPEECPMVILREIISHRNRRYHSEADFSERTVVQSMLESPGVIDRKYPYTANYNGRLKEEIGTEKIMKVGPCTFVARELSMGRHQLSILIGDVYVWQCGKWSYEGSEKNNALKVVHACIVLLHNQLIRLWWPVIQQAIISAVDHKEATNNFENKVIAHELRFFV